MLALIGATAPAGGAAGSGAGDGLDPSTALTGVAIAAGTNEAWAVGEHNLVLHRVAGQWRAVLGAKGSRVDLRDVVAPSKDAVWAVGLRRETVGNCGQCPHPVLTRLTSSGENRIHFDGFHLGSLTALTANSARDVWAVGDDIHHRPVVLHRDPSGWARVDISALAPKGYVYDIASSGPSDVWLVAYWPPNGSTILLHWDGTSWQRIPTPAYGEQGARVLIGSVETAGADRAWVAGYAQTPEQPPAVIYSWDGSSWSQMSLPGTATNLTVGDLATDGTRVLAVGSEGTAPFAWELVGSSWITGDVAHGQELTWLNRVAVDGTDAVAVGARRVVDHAYRLHGIIRTQQLSRWPSTRW